MREIRPSGSEGGVALTTPSLPLSQRSAPFAGPHQPPTDAPRQRIFVRRPSRSAIPMVVSGIRPNHNLALIGFMGTGKSSVGKLVAELLHFTFLDTDQVVEARAGK